MQKAIYSSHLVFHINLLSCKQTRPLRYSRGLGQLRYGSVVSHYSTAP